ncbi:MAG: hypothetical protein HOP28_18255 [Gemmatimonadales bacterium]|nr:hypothetical protein [Gemmatimonadales bacterium]
MFIELTDHLRCTVGHDESFLVLLPGTMDGRRVVTGTLGCPVCGRVVELTDGVADFGSGMPAADATTLTADAVHAFLGLGGPGGYVALAGAATALASELVARQPGVRLVLINPPIGTPDSPEASVLRAGIFPLNSSSMRGVVLGRDLAVDSRWAADGVRAVLPGLRIVAEGGEPPGGVEVLARTDGCWVGRRTS